MALIKSAMLLSICTAISLCFGCSSGSSRTYGDGGSGGADASSDGSAGHANGGFAGATGGASGDAGADGGDITEDANPDVHPDGNGDAMEDGPSDGDPDVIPGDLVCPVTFHYDPLGSPGKVLVAGEWNDFSLAEATMMYPADGGGFEATLNLAPGYYGYKYVADDTWLLDPAQGRRKYVGSPPIENSGVVVADCRLPTLHVESHKTSRPSQGKGTFEAKLRYVDGIGKTGADSSGYQIQLLHNGVVTTVSTAPKVSAEGNITVALGNLKDGKYRLTVRPKSKDGFLGAPVRLVFWIEPSEFSWEDALVYMILTDRYRDGNAANNQGSTAGADPRGDWMGGDLEGVTKSIEDGTLTALGVRAIWLTPFQTNPQKAYPASDGVHGVTGYHGYWPIKAREVDPRIGGEDALKKMVSAAHAKGIRILQDYVINHVHEEHEYVKAHPNWFRTGCVCGTDGCDWTSHALDCMFASYMPDIDHTVTAANTQFVDDAVWWMETFDLDGLRVDAVKHVEEAATRNLAAKVRETFEATGVRHFLMGETAMGWGDCPDPCNDENYGTIAKYIGPYGLDGQFDFVLYHGVSLNTFATDQKGMLHADYWFRHGMEKYPKDAIMTPYIGSHDTPRFATLADPDNASKAHNQWDNTAGAPNGALAYERTRLGFAWLLGLPGAPLLYYGDEYGQWGGADPNNRLMWKAQGKLSGQEKQTLAFIKKLGTARQELVGLRRGSYEPLEVSEDILVFARIPPKGHAAIVGLNRTGIEYTSNLSAVASKLGLKVGTTVRDRIEGASATVDGSGNLAIKIPARSAVIMAP